MILIREKSLTILYPGSYWLKRDIGGFFNRGYSDANIQALLSGDFRRLLGNAWTKAQNKTGENHEYDTQIGGTRGTRHVRAFPIAKERSA